MSVQGCGDECARHVHNLSEAEIWITYNRFQCLSYYRQRQWILDFLHTNTSKDTRETAFFVSGKHVCLVVWLATLCLSKSRYYDIRKLFNGGTIFIEHFTSPKSHQPKSLEAITWMQSYFNTIGDHMPDRMAIHLPSFLTNAHLYTRMKEEFESQGQKTVSMSQFYSLWQSEFSHVTIPKENRFTRCDTCTMVKNEIQKTADLRVRDELKKLLEKHNKMQAQEREQYYSKRRAARLEPNKYLSVIIDGMDQSKTDLPHLARKNKAACNMWVLRTHLSGAIVHGRRSYAFLDVNLWPHDSNLTINIVIQILVRQERLPATLYLQLDNCYRENKNQFVFGFLALLVHLGVFKEIEVGFLMVGHTHEDIDQFFSKLSHYLRQNTVATLPDLTSAITRAYADVPEVEVLSDIFDVRAWLSPHLEKLHNHSYAHYFRFTRNDTDKVVMHYKDWSDKPWQPSSGINLFQTYPSDTPPLLKPTLDRIDFKKLSAHAKQYRLKCGISEEAQKWWDEYLHELKTIVSQYPGGGSALWPVDQLQALATHQQEHHRQALSDDIEMSIIPEHVAAVHQKQVGECPQIYAGSSAPSRTESRECDSERTPNASGATRAQPKKKKQPTTSNLCSEASGKSISQSTSQRKRKKSNPSQTSCNPTEGDLVALCCPQYNERPQIAQVEKVNADRSCNVKWFDGSWNGKWKVYTYYEGRKKVAWKEEIPRELIISTNINLLANGKLSSECKARLKTLYT